MYGCDYDPQTHTYKWRETGEIVPVENIEQFARKVVDQAFARIADALVRNQESKS